MIELQTLDTCGSYKSYLGSKCKPFTINWKATEKALNSQIIEKARILASYNSKLVVVLQDTLFEYLKLKESSNSENVIQFYIYSFGDKLNFEKTALVDLENIINRHNNNSEEDLLEVIRKYSK